MESFLWKLATSWRDNETSGQQLARKLKIIRTQEEKEKLLECSVAKSQLSEIKTVHVKQTGSFAKLENETNGKGEKMKVTQENKS